MHIEFLVEEPSVEVVLNNLLQDKLPDDIYYQIHVFQGKQDLLRKLPDRLRGYSNWITDEYRIVVLVDEDREDCHKLKAKLEEISRKANLNTKSTILPGLPYQVVNRIVIEELEAWFFGDYEAIRRAYPRMPARLAKRASYRNPDAILGGTWEALERELQRAGYYMGGLAKIQVARDISVCMHPESNRSHSFLIFWQTIQALVK